MSRADWGSVRSGLPHWFVWTGYWTSKENDESSGLTSNCVFPPSTSAVIEKVLTSMALRLPQSFDVSRPISILDASNGPVLSLVWSSVATATDLNAGIVLSSTTQKMPGPG